MPLHVTLRMAPHVYNLRSRRSFRVIAEALRVGGDRFDSSAGAPDVALPRARTWLSREGWKRAGPSAPS